MCTEDVRLSSHILSNANHGLDTSVRGLAKGNNGESRSLALEDNLAVPDDCAAVAGSDSSNVSTSRQETLENFDVNVVILSRMSR